jgi:putative MFS transporter
MHCSVSLPWRFDIYAIFNGGPLILERIYPTSCSRPGSEPRRSVSCTGTSGVGPAIGTFATPWALSNLGISGIMWIAAGIAGVSVLVSYFTATRAWCRHGDGRYHDSRERG